MSTHVDTLVIGGGPGGSTAAAKAAALGKQVLLLEAGRHPRRHVGESLLAGITPILADIGALPAVQRAGFTLKTGSTHLQWGTTPRWDVWFADSDAYETSWFVERSRFDAILFECAAARGATIRTRASVRELLWEGPRLVGVRWRDAQGTISETTADHVIDASGAAALVARQRGWLQAIEGMAHHALWAHFAHARTLPAPRSHQAVFIAEPGRWFWCFPLGGGRASVGVVELGTRSVTSAATRLDELVHQCAALRDVLGPRARRDTPVRREKDWSYRVRPAAAPGVRLVGDAAGFIDPVLSTGVFLAMTSGWDAACSLQGDEANAAQSYAQRHAQQFDDLLRMVCFYYQQNLSMDDYFWESKRIVVDTAGPLSPRRAFVVLTSGLVGNLAADHAATAAAQRRAQATQAPASGDPQTFLCVHLQVPFVAAATQAIHDPDPAALDPRTPRPDRASLYFVLEADDPAAPCLARTASFSVDVIAPRLGNDVRREPSVAGLVAAFVALITGLDDGQSTIGALWRTHHGAIEAWTTDLSASITHVRTFGQ